MLTEIYLRTTRDAFGPSRSKSLSKLSCSTGCGLSIHMRDGVAINVTPDHDYPVNSGMACPKGWKSLRVLDAPDRVTTRANLQIREIPAKHALNLLNGLRDLGIVTLGAGADNIRNVTCSPLRTEREISVGGIA